MIWESRGVRFVTLNIVVEATCVATHAKAGSKPRPLHKASDKGWTDCARQAETFHDCSCESGWCCSGKFSSTLCWTASGLYSASCCMCVESSRQQQDHPIHAPMMETAHFCDKGLARRFKIIENNAQTSRSLFSLRAQGPTRDITRRQGE